MNKICKIIIILGLIFCVASFFVSCSAKNFELKGLKYFYFSYSVGYYKDASFSYELKKSDDIYEAKIKKAGQSEDEAKVFIVDEQFVQEFENILNENKIIKWNGYNKTNKYVLDGNGFYISAKFDNERDFHASGYESYPKDYRVVARAIENHFKKLL